MTKSKIMTSAQAVNDALRVLGKRDKTVILFGEGILDPSAFFGTTKNLEEAYGAKRIFEMPLSENALCGVAIGAAIAGKKSIISFHRVEFALLALEQIINNAAKMYYGSNGEHTCPILIRLIVGRGWGQGPAHSQSLETIFSSIPGLKVIAPVFPIDYKGMLISATEDLNPIICIEHRWTHSLKSNVPVGYYRENINEPKKIISGNHCTIVAISYSVVEALHASKILKEFGILIDLIDMRVLNPLDERVIVESVKKTGHLVTVDLGWKAYGVGSEIITRVVEKAMTDLKKPPLRLGLPDHPIPSSRGYLPGLYPSSKEIISGVLELINSKISKSQVFSIIDRDKENLQLDLPNTSFEGPF